MIGGVLDNFSPSLPWGSQTLYELPENKEKEHVELETYLGKTSNDLSC